MPNPLAFRTAMPSTLVDVRHKFFPSRPGSVHCARCDSLQLTKYSQKPYAILAEELGESGKGFRLAKIDEHSIDNTCALCKQFETLLHDDSQASDQVSRTAHRSLDLWCFHATLKPHSGAMTTSNRAKEWSMVYLMVNFHHVDRQLFFFEESSIMYPHYTDGRSVLMNSNMRPFRMSFGRPMDQHVATFDFVKKWISDCQNNHGTSCANLENPLEPYRRPKRLIDCRTRQVCLDVLEPYVCLSYVWGSRRTSESATGSVLSEDIPQTVSDAMIVTLKVGFRYLWVDALCIDQEKAEEKHSIIRDMDSIFDLGPADHGTRADHAAELTIIAVAGSDPGHGLPGVSNSRRSQPTLTFADHTFAAVADPRTEIRGSKWNTRGWTYQEYLLSRRRLVFTDSQVYFQCMSSHNLEGLVDLKHSDMFWKFFAFPRDRIGSTTESIYDRLEEYYRRELSFQTDILNAFSGVFQAYSKEQNRQAGPCTGHFYGIPIFAYAISHSKGFMIGQEACASLALGLAWQVRSGSSLSGMIYRLDAPESTFPSWSWADFKVRRHSQTPGTLKYAVRFKSRGQFDAAIGVRVRRLSGVWEHLTRFLLTGDDYTLFEPLIELTSLALHGSLTRDHLGSAAFDGFPHLQVHFHQDPITIEGPVLAVYVGIIEQKWSDGGAVFILVEEIEYRVFECDTWTGKKYRLIGACSQQIDLEGVDRSSSDWTETVRQKLPTNQEGQKWQRRTLHLV